MTGQHESGAQMSDPHARRLGRRSGVLPVHAEPSQEAVSRRAPPRRRSRPRRRRSSRPPTRDDQRRRPRRGSVAMARAMVATLSIRLERRTCLYSSVQRLSSTPAPDRQITASTPRSAVGSSSPRSGRHCNLAPECAAVRRTRLRDRVAVTDERVPQRRAQKPRRACEQVPHGRRLRTSPRARSKLPPSSRSLTVVRKRAASAPSTIRWS